MQRILLAICGAAILSVAVTFLLQIVISRGMPAGDIMLVTASATIVLSIGAAAFAYRALSRARIFASELERLTRSMDAAIKDVSLRSDRDAAKLEDLAASLSARIDALPTRGRASHAADDHAPRKARHAAATPHESLSPEEAAIEIALRRMIITGRPDISLQPIIAAGRGEAGGFDVHFHIQPEAGKPVDIRRLTTPVTDIDPAAYERLAVTTAAETARRKLGDVSERMPLHVAVSSALLEDGLEFAAVLDIFKLSPALAKTIVFSLPCDMLKDKDHAAALELLSNQGVRLACEEWSGSAEDLDALKSAGVRALKVPAERLLDHVKPRKGQASGAAMVQAASKAGLDLIATEVQSEEDAVSLIEMGVDLMSGERLSPPRLLATD